MPVILIDERSGWRPARWFAAATLAASIGVAVGVWHNWSRVLPDPARVASATAPFTLFAGREPASTASATIQSTPATTIVAASPAVACPYQRLDIVTSRGKAVGACVASTRVSQSGDLRTFRFDAQGVSSWSLRVDTAPDGTVMAAELSSPGEGRFICEQGACTGMRLGIRDAHGARAIDIAGAVLVGAVQGSPAAASTLGLTARLAVPPDDQDGQLACAGERISIVERTGAVFALCPSGGGGMMVLDGHRVYRLRGAAGDTIDVGVDANGTVDLVEIDGLGCHDAGCGGALTQPGPVADREAGRTFAFSGTTVTDGHPGGRAATLSGSAALPDF